MKITPNLRGAGAAVALLAAIAPAGAWEVVGGGPLPTFAATTPSVAPLAGVGFSTGTGGDSFSYPNWNPGYSASFGKTLLGVETKTGLAAGGDLFGMATGFDYSRSTMKLGYDLGRFKPFVTAGFGETKAPAFGAANLFANAGAPIEVASPFAPSTRTTSVGVGFDYAVTDKLSVGVSVQATQAQPTGAFWNR